MDSVLNGVGPIAALSAIPMLIGLLMRESVWAVRLRRTAILLALLLPTLMMLAIVMLYAQQPGNTPFDFHVNYQAAISLYAKNSSPYAVKAAYSFPFPTFYLYWLASGFGILGEVPTWFVWWIINIVLWIVCSVLLLRTLPRVKSARSQDIIYYTAASIPAFTTLWQGQTALFVLAGLVALHYALIHILNRKWIIAGGVGLALAVLIKPQAILVVAPLGIYTMRSYYENRRDNMRRIFWILAAALATILLVILLTLLLPGGVSLDTYRSFADVLPQIARPDDNITVIGSPAFVGSFVALRFGLPLQITDTIGSVITLLVIGAAVLWTLQREQRSLTELVAGWAVWAMVAPRVSWTWYASWCLPWFLLAVIDTLRNPQPIKRLTLFVLVLALLNLQLAFIPAAFLTITLLIWLLWTSFK